MPQDEKRIVGPRHTDEPGEQWSSKRASSSASGVVTVHTPSIESRTRLGSKLKKVAMTTSALTAPMGAAREAKYPDRPVTPRAA